MVKQEEPIGLSSSDQLSSLKSIRPKRSTATSSIKIEKPDRSLPAKKRKIALKSTTPTRTKYRIDTSSEDTDDSSSSHEEWCDLDENPPQIEKKKKTKNGSKREPKRDSYECETCGKTFTERRRYREHVARHNDHRSYECATCNKKFNSNASLKSHVRYIHAENPTIYDCTMCDYTTKKPWCLQEHFTRRHTEEYKYVCNVCGKHYKSERDYKAHMSNHDDGPQICDICGKSYPGKLSLNSHRNYKHVEKTKPYQCTICKKRLFTEKNLKAHMLQHSQSHVCEICGMKFGRKSGLTVHSKIHAEKTCLCPICGRAFTTVGTLRIHMITHTGVKSYSCDVCGLSYTQRSALLLHWRKKHPEATEKPPPVKLPNIGDFLKLTSSK